MKTCTRCGRTRDEKYLVMRKVYGGKKKVRCRAKSVCYSKFNRKRKKS